MLVTLEVIKVIVKCVTAIVGECRQILSADFAKKLDLKNLLMTSILRSTPFYKEMFSTDLFKDACHTIHNIVVPGYCAPRNNIEGAITQGFIL